MSGHSKWSTIKRKKALKMLKEAQCLQDWVKILL